VEHRELHLFLERGLESLGAPGDVERWVRLTLLIARWGGRLNLTGHPDPISIARGLLLEAAALEGVLPAATRIADLGSGAGIPGLPIALRRPETAVLLVESRERRHHFQRAAIRELSLENAEALRGRAETLDPVPSQGVISQAFAQPEQALAWMLPWSAPSGWLALATNPGFPGLEHPEIGDVALRRYAAPGGPARAVWLGIHRGPAIDPEEP